MKNLIFILTVCICTVNTVNAQKLTKNQARQILEKSFECLKSSDSATFVSLWYLDNTPHPYQERVFTEQDILKDFHFLKDFLDTALNQNLKFDHIAVRKTTVKERSVNFGMYNISAWFEYDQGYFKGFGYYLDYIDNKWVIRFAPDTSTLLRPSIKN